MGIIYFFTRQKCSILIGFLLLLTSLKLFQKMAGGEKKDLSKEKEEEEKAKLLAIKVIKELIGTELFNDSNFSSDSK